MSWWADALTGLENTIEIGIATPTVDWSSGAMLSMTIGGPCGTGVAVGVGLAAGEGEAVKDDGEAVADDVSVGSVEALTEAGCWPQPASTSSSPIPMPPIRLRGRRRSFM